MKVFKCNAEFSGSMNLDLCLICQKKVKRNFCKRQVSEHFEYQTGKYTLVYDTVKNMSSDELEKLIYHYSCSKTFSTNYVYVRRVKEARGARQREEEEPPSLDRVPRSSLERFVDTLYLFCQEKTEVNEITQNSKAETLKEAFEDCQLRWEYT